MARTKPRPYNGPYHDPYHRAPSPEYQPLVPSKSEAATYVGSVAEVVAVLVKYLPYTELARSRRVSKVWKHEIDKSTTYHTLLDFLVPQRDGEVISWSEQLPDRQAYTLHITELASTAHHLDSDDQRVITQTHPLLRCELATGDELLCYMDISKIQALSHALPPEASDAGWHRAFALQPPLKRSLLYLHYKIADERYSFYPQEFKYYVSIIEEPEGIRLWTIIRALSHVPNKNYASYIEQWHPIDGGPLDPDVLIYFEEYGLPSPIFAYLQAPARISQDHNLVQQAMASRDKKTCPTCRQTIKPA